MGQAQANPPMPEPLKLETGMDVEELVGALWDYSDGRYKLKVVVSTPGMVTFHSGDAWVTLEIERK